MPYLYGFSYFRQRHFHFYKYIDISQMPHFMMNTFLLLQKVCIAKRFIMDKFLWA